ncbi:MAG: agmatine deiminase family protein [Bacteroidia bacterium]|nr:agmatine deiminase family protein [Bacteroidota bacterium]MBK9425706.1 agmatine deiminase family protein [Bacteroidota bacterium]MBP9081617.1 agmatine deiminase family protein [Bacteroidia bacterium]
MKTFTGNTICKLVLLIFVITVIPYGKIFGQGKTENYSGIMYPEWIAQEHAWMIWPGDSSLHSIYLKVLKELMSEVRITVLFDSERSRDFFLLKMQNDSIDSTPLTLLVNENAKGFSRDTGPFFSEGKNGKLQLIDFKWTNFGTMSDSLKPEITGAGKTELQKFISKKTGFSYVPTELVLEQGMIDINKKGVAICFMESILQRNPSMDLMAITAELKKLSGINKIIWLAAAPVIDKITTGPRNANIFASGNNGHIESFVRFANDSTILFSTIDSTERKFDPISSGDFYILNENLVNLKNAIDGFDSPYQLFELPTPVMRFHLISDTVTTSKEDSIQYSMFEAGDIVYHAPQVSYINFLVCNNKVFVPQYYRAGLTDSEKNKDGIVMDLIAQFYPGKKIIPVNALPLNYHGKGIRSIISLQPKLPIAGK